MTFQNLSCIDYIIDEIISMSGASINSYDYYQIFLYYLTGTALLKNVIFTSL